MVLLSILSACLWNLWSASTPSPSSKRRQRRRQKEEEEDLFENECETEQFEISWVCALASLLFETSSLPSSSNNNEVLFADTELPSPSSSSNNNEVLLATTKSQKRKRRRRKQHNSTEGFHGLFGFLCKAVLHLVSGSHQTQKTKRQRRQRRRQYGSTNDATASQLTSPSSDKKLSTNKYATTRHVLLASEVKTGAPSLSTPKKTKQGDSTNFHLCLLAYGLIFAVKVFLL